MGGGGKALGPHRKSRSGPILILRGSVWGLCYWFIVGIVIKI